MGIEFNSGGTGNPITLTEPDGTPSILPVEEIQVTNGTLTQLAPGIGLIDTSGTEPVVIYVTTEQEFIDAFDTFNATVPPTGGIIKLGATIQLTQDHNLDFGNAIEVHGGQNFFAMNDAFGSWKFTITAGSRATFKQCTFNGSVNFAQGGGGTEENANSQTFLEINTATINSLILLEVQLVDIVGGSNGNNTGPGVYNPVTNVLEGAPIVITQMATWSRMVFSNLWILTPTAGQRKPYGSVGVLFNSGGTLGMAFTLNNWTVTGPANTNGPTGIPNVDRFDWAKSACELLITGAGTTDGGYAIVNYDQSTAVDPATDPSWQLYPTFWGPTSKDLDQDPTAVSTFGSPGDNLFNQYGQFYKIRNIATDTAWKALNHTAVINTIAASYTPLIADIDTMVIFNNALACTFLIPRDFVPVIPIGASWQVSNIGVGALTIDRAHPAVTFYKSLLPASTAFILAQYEVITIKKISANTFICYL